MKKAQFHLAALCCSLASLGSAQDSAGINTLMDLCIPISADGASARDGLRNAGWKELAKPEAAAPLANLIASQMWHLAADSSSERRLELTVDYTDGFYASLGNAMLGPIFTLEDQVAMVLEADGSLSCMWAGPKDDALLARIDAIGGFPAADGTVTAAKTQIVEFGSADYSRNETYAFIDSSDRAGQLPYAARLDRSPVQ